MTWGLCGDIPERFCASLRTVCSERQRKSLKIKGIGPAALHGVQGVASSNPAVPTSNTLGG